ncbi:HPr serine kinase-like protein [Roseibium hamelinense]|uniref:HPr serine kinase-like protein n=1 Tax=Roseibium hamelinense TaxID=150831 RepID=A0A562T0T9_9HYPH|nr:aldolase [Roseibium hamelinense]MTI44571.1 aldolase [Roseibium hamelinense]TWI87197.1 HPr serine kinase-like protein [Roseibium hamelinense]
MKPQTRHANCIVIGTLGILVFGASGSGKSALCDVLVCAAKAKGHFAAWVADDRVELEKNENRLLARAPTTLSGLREVRGFGIVEMKAVPVARIDLGLRLVPVAEIDRIPARPLLEERLLDIALPVLKVCENDLGGATVRLREASALLFPNVPDYI